GAEVQQAEKTGQRGESGERRGQPEVGSVGAAEWPQRPAAGERQQDEGQQRLRPEPDCVGNHRIPSPVHPRDGAVRDGGYQRRRGRVKANAPPAASGAVSQRGAGNFTPSHGNVWPLKGGEVRMKSLQPLGDQAALAHFADEAAALGFAAAVRGSNPPWLVDVGQAYTSVAVFFSLDRANFTALAAALLRLDQPGQAPATGRLHRIPCCYEKGPDLARVAEQRRLPADEVIRLHTAMVYTVYAIGFCPGFPYLGYLPEELCGVPRLEKPRLRVEAGSVG